MIENYPDFKKFLASLDSKPRLLLHACCAPCSTHVLMILKDYFDITIFFSNDNIYPKEEFELRLDEINKFVNKTGFALMVLDEGYNDKDYYNAVKGLENLGEKSERCYECYKLRLEKTAKKAKELGFDYFSTVLSISPYKNSKWINEIGYDLENKYGVKFLYSDYKKENGYKHSVEISNEYGMYRQDYCGCVYSLNERRKALESKKENENQ